MHWLAEQLKNLHELESRSLQYRDLSALNVAGSAAAEKQAREAFVTAVCRLVEEVAGRAGVEACFAAHEGLVVHTAGRTDDAEAMAAMAQNCLDTGRVAATSLKLGAVQQMVVVGEQQKLALFAIGQMALGILGMSDANLASALS